MTRTRSTLLIATLLGSALMLGGCAHRPNNAQLGTGVGAVAGGFLGDALFGSTLGTVGGAAAGAGGRGLLDAGAAGVAAADQPRPGPSDGSGYPSRRRGRRGPCTVGLSPTRTRQLLIRPWRRKVRWIPPSSTPAVTSSAMSFTGCGALPIATPTATCSSISRSL